MWSHGPATASLCAPAGRLAAVAAKHKRARVEAIAEKIAAAANAQNLSTIVSLMADLTAQYRSQGERRQDEASVASTLCGRE